MTRPVRVSPDEPNPTHDVALVGEAETFGLIMQSGRGLKRQPNVPSTLRFTGGGTKFGDFDPQLTHIEQRTWDGGRGQDEFVDDPSRYFTGDYIWTLTPGRLCPGPIFNFARGHRNVAHHTRALLGTATADLKQFQWLPLFGTRRGYASSVTPAANMTADKAWLWVRRVGQPGTLTFTLRSDSTDSPGTVLKTVTRVVADFPDVMGVYKVFDWTTTEALTGGTKYWLALTVSSTDNAANHWEVGCDDDTTISGANSTATSADASAWVADDDGPYFYFRVVEADANRRFLFFILDQQLYAVDVKASGAASALYMNGFRGEATSASASTLVDSNAAFSGGPLAWVRIIRGTGAGQAREVTITNGTTLTVTTTNWDINPSTDSEYVVYAMDLWTELATTGLGAVKDVAVVNNTAYFAHGVGDAIRKLRFNAGATPPAHEYEDDGTNTADLLHGWTEPGVAGPTLWRAVNGTTMEVSTGPVVAWGGGGITFAAGIDIGDTTWAITELLDYDNQLIVFKEDSAWSVAEGEAQKIPVGLDRMPEATNGAAAVVKDLFLYFSWSYSVEQYTAGTLSDLGPWRGTGLYDNRSGVPAALENGIGVIFAAIDAGPDGLSSVMMHNGQGWHELFRAFNLRERIQNVKWQPCPGTRPRLWVSYAGDLGYMEMPLNTLNPLADSKFPMHHESAIVFSTIDTGAVSLNKFFSLLTVANDGLGDDPNNLGYRSRVKVDYQSDGSIGTPTWVPLGELGVSPVEKLVADLGNVRSVRLRLRLEMVQYSAYGLDGTFPYAPVVRGTVLSGFARVPYNHTWALTFKVGHTQQDLSGQPDHDPDELIAFLEDAATNARPMRLYSWARPMHDKRVIIEPQPLDIMGKVRKPNGTPGGWQGTVSVVFREV